MTTDYTVEVINDRGEPNLVHLQAGDPTSAAADAMDMIAEQSDEIEALDLSPGDDEFDTLKQKAFDDLGGFRVWEGHHHETPGVEPVLAGEDAPEPPRLG